MNDLSLQNGLQLSSFQKHRVAVLVDGDNVPHSQLNAIEDQASGLGDVIVRRVYADIAQRTEWAAETNYLTVHCTTSAGKNRADIHLVIGALDIAHRGLATHFLILSDDRDFGPLVAHLREIGMSVEWAGKPKAAAKPSNAQPVKTKQKSGSEIDQRLRKIFKGASNGLSLQAIGSQMRNESTVKAQTGKADWRSYLKSKPELYELNVTTQETIVTLKS